MFNLFKQVGDYAKGTVQAARYIGQGLNVTFNHMRRRPVTVQYPYEKVISFKRFRGSLYLLRKLRRALSYQLSISYRRVRTLRLRSPHSKFR